MKRFGLCALALITALTLSIPLHATLDPSPMAKPLSGLRDYDGTYNGAMGTGTFGYMSSNPGTLYRDNEDYGALSGCMGEGCGRHPGVDIPVADNSSVYASYAGQVVLLPACGGGWGGLVVIKSTNPFYPFDTIYFSYAHLNTRYVQMNQWVNTGDLIGLSGGVPGHPCAGNSSGAHLHYQIDKHHVGQGVQDSPNPYFPAGTSARDSRDDDFQVTRYTYNPIPLITNGYRWGFNHPSAGTTPMFHRELWGLINIGNSGWGVANSALWMDNAFDSNIWRGKYNSAGTLGDEPCGMAGPQWAKPCSKQITVEGDMYNRVYLDIYNTCVANPGKIYFITSTDPVWNETKMVPYYPTGPGLYQQHIYMKAQNPRWTGIITGIRIDSAESCSTSSSDPTYYGEITIER